MADLPPSLRRLQQNPWIEWGGMPAVGVIVCFAIAVWVHAQYSILNISGDVLVHSIDDTVNYIFEGLLVWAAARGYGHKSGSVSFTPEGNVSELAKRVQVIEQAAAPIKAAALDPLNTKVPGVAAVEVSAEISKTLETLDRVADTVKAVAKEGIQ